MESRREVERQYQILISEVKNNDFYKIDLTNRVNCYVCQCGHITKTKDVDAGVTPFMHTCEKCGLFAKSSFYKDIAPEQEPTQEWFRPTWAKILKLRSKPNVLEHVLRGGLLNRKIQNDGNFKT